MWFFYFSLFFSFLFLSTSFSFYFSMPLPFFYFSFCFLFSLFFLFLSFWFSYLVFCLTLWFFSLCFSYFFLQIFCGIFLFCLFFFCYPFLFAINTASLFTFKNQCHCTVVTLSDVSISPLKNLIQHCITNSHYFRSINSHWLCHVCYYIPLSTLPAPSRKCNVEKPEKYFPITFVWHNFQQCRITSIHYRYIYIFCHHQILNIGNNANIHYSKLSTMMKA